MSLCTHNVDYSITLSHINPLKMTSYELPTLNSCWIIDVKLLLDIRSAVRNIAVCQVLPPVTTSTRLICIRLDQHTSQEHMSSWNMRTFQFSSCSQSCSMINIQQHTNKNYNPYVHVANLHLTKPNRNKTFSTIVCVFIFSLELATNVWHSLHKTASVGGCQGHLHICKYTNCSKEKQLFLYPFTH